MISMMKQPSNQNSVNDRVSSISSISSQEMENGIIVRPKREIIFKYISNKDITAEFDIINQSQNKKYQYRILCTSSKSYKVEPYKGEINPNEKIHIRSTLISKGVDIEKRMRDQFKIEYVCLEDDFIEKNVAWNTYPKKEIRLSISIMFQKSITKSVSPSRGTPSINAYDYQNNMNKSQKSFQSPNQSQLTQNNSQISYTKGIYSNQQNSPKNIHMYPNSNNMMNNSNEFVLDSKSPEESKMSPDIYNTDLQKTLKLPNTYSSNTNEMQSKYPMQQQSGEENQKYQQKYNMLRKRQDEQLELIKTYKEDIKKFHNEISKLKFIFRKNESKIENSNESKKNFLLQPYQLSILIFAFLLIGALIRI